MLQRNFNLCSIKNRQIFYKQFINNQERRLKMLRVCVIGMGSIGNIHAKIYKEYNNSKLVGVCDVIGERARSSGEKFNVPYYYDAEKMLKELKPDICSVTTGGFEYSSDHYLPTIQALEAGSHVLCEKPICNDLEKASLFNNNVVSNIL
jgi:predicted dehydrogenase